MREWLKEVKFDVIEVRYQLARQGSGGSLLVDPTIGCDSGE